MSDEKKKRMYKVSHPDTYGDFCIFQNWGSLGDAEFDSAEVGTVITIELVEMTEEEFDDLGEFEGW